MTEGTRWRVRISHFGAVKSGRANRPSGGGPALGSPGDALGGGFGRLAVDSGVAGSRRPGWVGGFRRCFR